MGGGGIETNEKESRMTTGRECRSPGFLFVFFKVFILPFSPYNSRRQIYHNEMSSHNVPKSLHIS